MSSQYCDCRSPTCHKCSKDPECFRKIEDPVIAWYEEIKKLGIDGSCCGKGVCGVPGQDGDCNVPRPNETVPDKLIFICEWYEKGSDLIKKYVLIYYGIDGSCEVKDVINHQRFLKRMKLDTVTLCELYLGNVINIYGRQFTLIEYADSCTEQYLEPQSQLAFLLIKPHAVQCLGKILIEVENYFKVLRARMTVMTSSMVSKLYGQYGSEEFYLRLLEHMTSGPVVVFLIVGKNCIERLNCLAGEMDPQVAKLKHPSSLRAIYGKGDIVFNAVHVSESPACVEKDSSMFFTTCRTLLPSLSPGTAIFQCSTLCIIKPHAVKAKAAGWVIDSITRANYKITAFELFYLDRSHAEEIYEIYKGVLPEYSDMTLELALGPCYIMEISGCGEDTPANFREFSGPYDPIIARKLRPKSLRAKFGISKVQNAIHCSDLCEDAEMEVDYFFRILQQL